MPGECTLFGNESPLFVWARVMLGINREDTPRNIRDKYYALQRRFHSDRYSGSDADQRSQAFAKAYSVLTNPAGSKQIESEFLDSLSEPVRIGVRYFGLGAFYGVRTYVPGFKITDRRRLLGTGSSNFREPTETLEHLTHYRMRCSVLETPLADLMLLFYDEHADFSEQANAFHNRHNGGMNDLGWIKESNLALYAFLERDYASAESHMRNANKHLRGNAILMYRWGITLEALAAVPGLPTNIKNKHLNHAINLYENCLTRLKRRKTLPKLVKKLGLNQRVKITDPRSLITVMMQLADAYKQTPLGAVRSHSLWQKVKKLDPYSMEAQEKGRSLLALPFVAAGRTLRMLPAHK